MDGKQEINLEWPNMYSNVVSKYSEDWLHLMEKTIRQTYTIYRGEMYIACLNYTEYCCRLLQPLGSDCSHTAKTIVCISYQKYAPCNTQSMDFIL